MHELVAYTIVGLAIGATYAIAASGLVVTYSTTGVFNIAHGAIGMFMAFTYWQFSVAWHWPPPLAVAVCVLVIAPLMGVVLERIVRPVADASVALKLVVTIAVMVLLIGLVQTIWKGSARQLPNFFGDHGFEFSGVFVTWQQVITVGAAVAVAIGLRLLLFNTRIGITMRGVVDNRSLVALNGGRPRRVAQLSWAVGASLAAVAGILVASQLQLAVFPLTLLVVDAYAAAMVGRLRSLPLTFAGALGIGLLQSYAVGYMPQGGFWDSVPMQGLRLSIPAVLLFAVLLALPQDKIRGAVGQVRRLGVEHPAVHPLARRRRRPRGGGGGVDGIPRPPEPDLARDRAGLRSGHAVAGPAHRVGRAGVAVPDDVRGHRRRRHVPLRPQRVGARPGHGRGVRRGGGRGDRPARPAPARPVPGAGHPGLRAVRRQHVLPELVRLQLRRVRPRGAPERGGFPLPRPAGVRHLPGGGVRGAGGRPADPAPRPLRPSARP